VHRKRRRKFTAPLAGFQEPIIGSFCLMWGSIGVLWGPAGGRLGYTGPLFRSNSMKRRVGC
jgi:hypothetical protein